MAFSVAGSAAPLYDVQALPPGLLSPDQGVTLGTLGPNFIDTLPYRLVHQNGQLQQAINDWDGVVRPIDVPGHNSALLSGISTSGVLVGTAYNRTWDPSGSSFDDTDTVAFMDDHGKVTPLGTLGGRWSRGLGINAKGQVVGYSPVEGYNDPEPFLYENGQMTSLGKVGTASSSANAINDWGQIVGSSWGDGQGGAFIYDHGQVTRLSQALAAAGANPNSSQGHLINNQGVVVGQVRQGLDEVPFMYRDGQATLLPSLVGVLQFDEQNAVKLDAMTVALDLNDAGDVVGRSFRGAYDFRAILWRDGQLIDLNDWVQLDPEVSLVSALAIDDHAHIVALGSDNRFYLLTPSVVPEPANAALMGLGLLGMWVIRRRSRAAP